MEKTRISESSREIFRTADCIMHSEKLPEHTVFAKFENTNSFLDECSIILDQKQNNVMKSM